MLKVNFTARRDAIGLGISYYQYPVSNPGVRFPDGLYSNNWRPGYYMDVLWSDCTIDIPIGEFSAYDLLNMQNPLGPMSITLKGFRPRTSRAYSGGKDGARYGSAIGGLLNLGRPTRSDHRTTWTKETDTVHLSARGSLQDDVSNRDFYPSRTASWRFGWNFQRYTTSGPDSGRIYRQLSFSRPNDVDTFTVATPSSVIFGKPGLRFRLSEIIAEAQKAKLLRENIVFGYARNLVAYYNWQILWENYSDQGGQIRYAYVLENTADSLIKVDGIYPHAFHKYDVTVTVDWELLPVTGEKHIVPGTYFIPEAKVTISRAYVLVESSSNRSIPGGYPYPVDSCYYQQNLVASSAHVISKPNFTNDKGVEWWRDKSSITYGYPEERKLHSFYDFVDDVHGDLRGLAAISANEALKGVRSDTNYLESLPELPSVLKWGSKATDLAKVIRNFSQGNPKAVPELIDFLANSYLLWKYGVSPMQSDIEESYRIARKYAREMDTLSTPLKGVFYGKKRYDIPVKVPGFFGRAYVVVRTKMVLRGSPGGVLAGVVALDEVGLLPTLGRIWDLVPFSFVIDWFTGLSNKFETIDGMAIRATLDVDYYVHTYTYQLALDPRDYAPFRRRSGSDDVSFRVFIRERSLMHPMIGASSRFDLQPPAGLKRNLLAAGSLLWVSS